jgi:hypothetical protein
MKHKWIAVPMILFIVMIGLRSVQGKENALGSVTAPSLWVWSTAIDFGPVPINQTGWWYFSFKNIGNDPLTITTDATFNAPFSGTLPACATALSPGDVCSYILLFSPTETGVFNDTLQFETDAGPFSVQVQGEGTYPHFYVDSHLLDFGSVLVGDSQTQAITIYNTGAYHLDLTTSSPPSPDFGSSSGDCSGGLSPGDSCIVYLTFQPTILGRFFSDTYTISTVAGDTEIALQGSSRTSPLISGAAQRVTPRSLDFGPVHLGESKTLTVTITNESFDTSITGWSGGGVPAPFSASQNCASGVSPGNSCQFFYTFTPTAEGVFMADSNVSNSVGSFTVNLRAEGVWSEPLVRETALDFGPLQSVTAHEAFLTNIGHKRLYLNNVTVSDSNLFTPAWGCGSGLPPYQPTTGCGIDYDFSIATPELVTETSTISTDGGDVIITLKAGAQPVTLAQEFVPDSMAAGDTTTLQYHLTNPNLATTHYFVGFSNTLPPGINYANPVSYSASPECGAPTLTPIAGNPPTFIMSDGTIMGGDTCVISLNLTATEDGNYINTVNFVEAGTDPNDPTWIGTSNEATANLVVGPKVFLPFVIRP